MSGRPDHAAARLRRDGVEEAGQAPVNGAGSPEVTEAAAGGSAAPDGAAPDAAQDTVEAAPGTGADAILTDIVALTAQRDDYLESLQRLKADFDNYRKRVERLREEQSARAEANLVTKLLPVLDNLDLAWAHLGPDDGEEAAGSEEARAIGQAHGQLLDVLGREGLERVDEVGVAFDPTVHDAVAHAEATTEEGGGADGGAVPAGADAAGDAGADAPVPHVVSVDGVLRAGYRWRGQVLRPAMVRVRG